MLNFVNRLISILLVVNVDGFSLQESKDPKHRPDVVPYAVPKELWYLVDHINYHGIHEEGLFMNEGKQKDHMDIR